MENKEERKKEGNNPILGAGTNNKINRKECY